MNQDPISEKSSKQTPAVKPRLNQPLITSSHEDASSTQKVVESSTGIEEKDELTPLLVTFDMESLTISLLSVIRSFG